MRWAESHIKHSGRVLLRRYLEKSSCSSEFGCCPFIKQPKLVFYFLCYLLWRIIKFPTVFRPRKNICYYNINFESNCVFRERERRTLTIQFFCFGYRSQIKSLPKAAAQPAKQNMFMKTCNKSRDVPATQLAMDSVQMGEYCPLLEPIRLKDL